MKKSKIVSALLVAFTMSLVSFAQVPQAFKYQSAVVDSLGHPMVNKTIQMIISVHNISVTGTVIYMENQSVTTNPFGLINLEIGNGTNTSGSFSSIYKLTGTKWMEVKADFGTGFVPMGTSQLLSVPYALLSDSTLHGPYIAGNGIKISHDSIINKHKGGIGIKISNDSIINKHIAGRGIKISNDSIINRHIGGNGIKISNDSIINRHIAGVGIKISNDSISSALKFKGGSNRLTKWLSTTDSIGKSIMTDDGYYLGVANGSLSITASSGSNAIQGFSTSGAGSVGVLGSCNGGTGVKGQSTNPSGGTAISGVAAGNGIGIYGSAPQPGLAGQFAGDVVVNGNFTATGSTQVPTIYGNVVMLANAQVNGNLTVSGTLNKGSGTFKIDHPSDPQNKYLYHSFVESPDMMNIYNGNITTDATGDAEVQLPTYFDTLNKDFRYQLTVIGQFAQAIVAEKINGNKFKIKTDKPNVEVSWMVTGVRKDPFANKNRVITEVEKSPEDKGKYLYPELYGASEDLSIFKKDYSKKQK